jgi:hypothetical protein
MKMTQKELDDWKRDLRYKHQKRALDACIVALGKIKETCEGAISWCKEHNAKPSVTATNNLEKVKETLKLVEECKQNCKKEMQMPRPASDIFQDWEE